MSFLRMCDKTLNTISSVFSFAGETVDGIIDLGSQAKKSVNEAKSRIVERHKQIKEIAKSLGISYEKAAKLLDNELSR